VCVCVLHTVQLLQGDTAMTTTSIMTDRHTERQTDKHTNRERERETWSWSDGDVAEDVWAPVNGRPSADTEHVDHRLHQLLNDVARLVG